MDDGTDDLHGVIRRIIDAFCWRVDGPDVAALAVLGQPRIADGLRAADVVRALADLHRPRVWNGGIATVCAHCDKHWPCATAELLIAGAVT